MKIVHVVRRFSLEDWGGIEECVLNLALEQKSLGHDVEILCTKALNNLEEETIQGISIKRFDYFYPYLLLDNKMKLQMDYKGGNPYSFKLLNYIKKKNIDVIHCHTMGRLQESLKRISEKNKIQFLVTLHGGFKAVSNSEEQHLFKPKLSNLPYGFILKHFLNSKKDYAKACISHEEISKNTKSFYIQNGVSNKFSNERINIYQEYNIPSHKKILLNVARIDKQKNQMFLLESLFNIDLYNYHLVLCGNITDHDYYNKMISFINKHNLNNNVTLLHDVKPRSKELSSLYESSFAFVLPSIHEPFGIVILEAWQFSLPVIANQVGGVKDLSSTGNCLGLDLKNKRSLDKMIYKLEKMMNIDHLKKENLNLVNTTYSWQNVASMYLDLYLNKELS